MKSKEEIIHSLKPRKSGKYNPRITLCNKSLRWTRTTSNAPEIITCKCCKNRRNEIIKHFTEEKEI